MRGDARPTSPTGRSRSRSPAGAGRRATASGWSPARRPTSPQLAEQLRGRPLLAHDAKALGGGGRTRPARRRAAREPRPRARHDGRRLPDRPGAAHLRPRTSWPPTRGSRAAPGRAPSRDSSRSQPRRARRPAIPAVDARLAGELAARQRERLAEFGLERLLNEVEMPLIEVLAAMERVGREARRRAPRRDRRGDGGADRRARARDLRARRPRVHDRLAAAARRGAVRGARADQEAPRQDRLLDRRPGPRPDPRRARDRRARSRAGAS